MKSRFWTALGLAVLLASGVAAEQIDQTQGNWEGEWTSEGGPGGKITAKIVALGGEKYKGVFDTEIEGQVRTIVIPLVASREGGVVKLRGEFDLGPDLGGAFKMSGEIKDGKYTGVSEGEATKAEVTMTRVEKKSPTLGAEPPAGAVVLFDGTNLDQWRLRSGEPAPWTVKDGAMTVAFKREGGKVLKGDIISKPTFRDAKIHLEFKTPYMPAMRGQMRGNSGVYVGGLYEVQVLDSFGEPPRDNEAGGIYRAAAPKENAALPPGEWQTYDITFRAPRFDESGKLEKPGEMTVVYNGVLVHEKTPIKEPTPGNAGNDPTKPGPILLQDHGNPVSFRNIWFVPLED